MYTVDDVMLYLSVFVQRNDKNESSGREKNVLALLFIDSFYEWKVGFECRREKKKTIEMSLGDGIFSLGFF